MRDPRAAAIAVTGDEVRAILRAPDKISLVAQPIIDGRRAQVTGYEALARFDLGRPAPPDKVFAAAAAEALGDELEAAVIRRALELSRTKPPNCFVTINVDPLNILSDRVIAELDAFGSFGGVVLELTEQHEIADVKAVRKALDKLRSRGAMIAIDDAGAGYSGLKQILDLQPQLLKIDRALVTSIHDNEAKRALVQMLGELAGRLDAWLLAEGIEEEGECAALSRLGVPLFQGYFFGKPQAPWAGIDPNAQRVLTSLSSGRAAPPDTLGPLVERCPVVRASDPWPERARVAVRVDDTRRPIEMRVLGEDGARTRAANELLRVSACASRAAVALRAATRLERLRWDPVVVVDDEGNLGGVVPLHRLVCALASEGSAPDAGMPESFSPSPTPIHH